jgi:hypothetical protein
MFENLVHRFLNKIFEPKPPIHTVPKKVVYFCHPFTGSHFALKSTDFAMLLILISTFALSFAPLNASLLSVLPRIKFLSF